MAWVSSEELIGQKFGRRTVLKEIERDNSNTRYLEAQCDCGRIDKVRLSSLRARRADQCKKCSEVSYDRTQNPSRFYKNT